MPASRFVPVFALAVLCALPRLRGQESVVPYIPEKESPFFVLNDSEENPGRKAKQLLDSPQNQYPMNKTGEQSASKMFVHFFTDMFGSVRLVKMHSASALKVDPATFSLDDRREITVTFTVENRTNKLVKLDFPTSQRIEILVRDSSGKVIEKWSDDRAFQDVSGVVMINPGEHIQYEEKIATRDMQPGQTYIVEASMANNPEFTKTATVKPSGKPRAPRPPFAPAHARAEPAPNQG